MFKKFFLTSSVLILSSLSVFSEEFYQMKIDSEYLFFSDDKIQSIKSNNPSVISAQRVATFSSDGNQIIFIPKKIGIADVQITTTKGVSTYSIEIKKDDVKHNDTFMEIDFPGIVEQ
ncbi:MAG: hypothetical protein ACI37Z_08615 [Candidatus Gastranaerophilaceae bacterium]